MKLHSTESFFYIKLKTFQTALVSSYEFLVKQMATTAIMNILNISF